MHDYMSRVVKRNLQSTPTPQVDHSANADELRQYCSLAGTLLYPGRSVILQARFLASILQQELGFLKVGDLESANEIVGELQKLQPWFFFLRSPMNIKNVIIIAITDAFHYQINETYDQTNLFDG